ncbi:MAG: penicillin-binding protein 2 [Thiohalocapsa sp.]|jgi:cell division protein FtsI (penicillin-binding protein 3)|uniref:peptidoglycan D,D-transpeptidase FtsI family protein n=1 Tax=Thiohalocapsa sp. TaxID=2497641 RepID=UPI0025FECE44|nr:penicillin-binding transpeptidase domain-containing protein [Thiohalocapsa sp.]MCG6943042.1 penicillin-binding protein 2 [Thiohalocapsa sp.]
MRFELRFEQRKSRERMKARLRRAELAQRKPPNFIARRAALGLMLTAACLSVVAAAFHRQVLENEFLRDEGEKRFLREREIAARRGMVTDRNGEPLAISTSMSTIWADPQVLAAHGEALPALATALEVPASDLIARLNDYVKHGRRFIYLRRRVEPQCADAVQAVIDHYRLTGVGMDNEYRRFYPGGEMFGQVVGFTNVDDVGQEGIELTFENRLRAEPGKRRVIQDGRGRVVEEVEQIKPPSHGKDVALSLDRRLQFLAYRELKRAVAEHRAKSGTAVLLDVTSGEVLAMVNQPAFNPNAARSEPAENRRNRALTDVFEPGSTMKPLVVATALEAGIINPNTPVNTSPGVLQVGHNRVKDIHNYGLLTATGVITKSSNVGVVKIAQRMDRAMLWQTYHRLGFGKVTGVEFPGERAGFLPYYDGWSRFEHATLAFGYGLNMTSLQLAQAYATIANGGVHLPVSLQRRDSVPEGERIFSAATARAVRAMMETVVSDQGTARRAKIPGYRVGGKTGTAKKATGHGYAPGKYQAVFAGMAPISKPRFVMVVMIDEPQGKYYYGGIVAAPTFAKVMQAALRLYNVAPDDPQAELLLAGLKREASR